MGFSNAFKKISYILLIAFVILGGYVALSLFEVWAQVPFWIKDIALVGSLIAFYIFARKALTRSANKNIFQGNGSPVPGMAFLGILSLMVGGALYLGIQNAGPDTGGKILRAFMLTLRQPPAAVHLEVEVIPPAHAKTTSTFLFSKENGPIDEVRRTEALTFAEGSKLRIQVAETLGFPPDISFGENDALVVPTQGGSFSAEIALLEPGNLEIRVGPYVFISQALNVIPDQEPSILFSGIPKITPRKSIQLAFDFSDDHKVDQIYLEIKRRNITGMETRLFPISFAEPAGEKANNPIYINLLSHPWAGSTVNATLIAMDNIGQEGRSDTINLILPEKTFQKTVAQNLVSIRKALLTAPERKTGQVRRLDLQSRDRNAYDGHLASYMAVRSAYWKLKSSETPADLKEVTDLLWLAALGLEDDGSVEAQAVQNVISEMERHLAGAVDAQTFTLLADTLQSRMGELFDKEFQVLSQKIGMRRPLRRADIPAMKTFESLLERMKAHAREGDREAARKSLYSLQKLFENMAITSFTEARF